MLRSDCPCAEPGWCEQYQVRMTEHWLHLCRTHAGYRALWEAGKGPGQFPRVKPGLGDMVASGLAAVGITPERYQSAKAAVGLKRPCGCLKRKQKLNELGRKLGIG
jgi:hypothetical protein